MMSLGEIERNLPLLSKLIAVSSRRRAAPAFLHALLSSSIYHKFTSQDPQIICHIKSRTPYLSSHLATYIFNTITTISEHNYQNLDMVEVENTRE